MKFNVVNISFLSSNRKYMFSCNEIKLYDGDCVIVESEKGLQFGIVNGDSFEVDESSLIRPLKNVNRKATLKDIKINENNIKDSEKALLKSKELVKKFNLNMIMLNSYFTFDRNQLVFNFIADDRVDFRELAKELASIFKTRIELRQIGVRDKAKEIGGLGPCGRFLCCNLFLNEFDSVSINMAKNQYLSLKPNKINGICGRLLCCLNYEDELYTDEKRKYPSIGTIFKYNGQQYKIISLNLFKNSIVAENNDKNQIVMDLKDYESCK